MDDFDSNLSCKKLIRLDKRKFDLLLIIRTLKFHPRMNTGIVSITEDKDITAVKP